MVVVFTFNSLYGIPLLFIPNIIAICGNFQFPLWDTTETKPVLKGQQNNFQFPLWDTSVSTPPFAPERKDFQFPLWDTLKKRIDKAENRIKLSIPFMGYN